MKDINSKTIIEYINLMLDNLDLIILDIDNKWPKNINVTRKKYICLFKDILSNTYSITFQNKYYNIPNKFITVNLAMKSDWMVKTEDGIIPLVIAVKYHETILPVSVLDLIAGINCGSVYINYNGHIWEAIHKYRHTVAKFLYDNTSIYSSLSFKNINIYLRGKKFIGKEKAKAILNDKYNIKNKPYLKPL